MKKNKESQNLLELIPSKLCESIVEEGKEFVLLPKFPSKFGRKFLMPIFKNPFVKVELDEIGRFIWSLVDGKKDIYEISELAKEHFGDKIEPVYERVGKFFSMMKMSSIVEFKDEVNRL